MKTKEEIEYAIKCLKHGIKHSTSKVTKLILLGNIATLEWALNQNTYLSDGFEQSLKDYKDGKFKLEDE